MTEETRKLKLPIFLGINDKKEEVFVDMTRMPYFFAIGDTLTGKTMWEINVLLTLMDNLSPEMLKLVIIDTKMVDFYPFRDSKYLMGEMITETSNAVDCFKGITNEIENRYRIFSKAGVRNIEEYNAKSETKIPYIVCVIDEIAEIIINFPKETEEFFEKICSMASPVGIHLIAGTSEVMPEVMTPKVRLNFKNFMTFKMRKERYDIDYMRAYLEGLEPDTLNGKGDHFFKPAYDEPIRLDGKFISDEDIEKRIK